MTYDLSDTLSDGYEGMGPVISNILHAVTPLVAGRFVREQGQTQGISITDMLNGGARFIDFRIMYTRGPDRAIGEKDWYCLHGCESQKKALEYLKDVRTWMDAHPQELVVLWASRHGNTGACGTDQYPDTTPQVRQAFFKQVQEVFGELLFNSTQRLNETSVLSLQKRNQRLVWLATDYVESTESSPLAVDAKSIDNQLVNSGHGLGAIKFLRQGGPKRRDSSAQNRFLLMSMAAGVAKEAIEAAAKIEFLPNVFGTHDKWRKECAATSGVPNMTFCPKYLMEWSLMTNFYNQKVIDMAYVEGAADLDVDFPNAIYLDAMDLGGLIRTGTATINPLEEGPVHGTDGFAYSATVIAATV
ncbi:unnamed protein product [Durusdinium trenchii]|uniref:Uncharacterized protein n=2 Tax=Durusdinium trenchii TaxID=1381693 RepID=A0ABP0SAD0_9DINO